MQGIIHMKNIEDLKHWHFELTEQACNHLLGLVLDGKKRATSSSVYSFRLQGMKIPETGDLSVITDWDGHPRCVIRTTAVSILPYKDITFELAVLEGEDDTLDSWKLNHERFFREEGSELGYPFTETMDIVFEEFEVVETME
ncbi:MAG: ASCH domain-containing protein [Solobacterium sp.]|nr:ASCH domain-containing protein [Solobacterium sp.]